MRKSRLAKHQQYKLVELFVAGATARTAAAIADVNKTTASYYFQRLRQLIHAECEQGGVFEGAIELDQAVFSLKTAVRSKATVEVKMPVWCVLQRSGKLYTLLLQEAEEGQLVQALALKIRPNSVIYLNVDAHEDVALSLIQQGLEVVHSHLFADGEHHLNSIENFWIQARRHLRKFNGVSEAYFHLFIKECEWRFNERDPKVQLAMLKALVQQHLA
ncbi:MAG: transposase [Neisseriaceae bacterium]|nr:transposase [Neisseriaceae bacterium]